MGQIIKYKKNLRFKFGIPVHLFNIFFLSVKYFANTQYM